MRQERFSDLVSEIRKRPGWYNVFPAEIDFKRTKYYARGNFPPDLFEGEPNFLWPGARDVLEMLMTPRLEGARLYKAVYAFRRELVKIDQGLHEYGKYTKGDRISGRPQKDYQKVVQAFLGKLEKMGPRLPVGSLRRSLLYVEGRPLTIDDPRDRAGDRKRILRFCQKFLAGLKGAKREGRPLEDDNILIYHLVNNLTVWRRKKTGEVLRNKNGSAKLERRWDDAARVLIWVHYRKLPMAWVASFIQRNARSAADPAMARFKKIIQRKYAHLGPPKGQKNSKGERPLVDLGKAAEAGFWPLGIRRFILQDDAKFAEFML